MNIAIFQQLADLGSNSVPDSVELRIEESIDGLGREMRMSALGNGEGIFEKIQVVEELRMVRRDTIVVCGPLLADQEIVWGNSSGTQGDGECREDQLWSHLLIKTLSLPM